MPEPPVTPTSATLIDPTSAAVRLSTVLSTSRQCQPHPRRVEELVGGPDFTPTFVEGLRLSADYTTSTRRMRSAVSYSSNCSISRMLPAGRRVRRSALRTLPPASQGVPSPRSIRLNVAATYPRLRRRRTMSGHELARGYFYLIGTRQPRFERQAAPNLAFIEFAGLTGGLLGAGAAMAASPGSAMPGCSRNCSDMTRTTRTRPARPCDHRRDRAEPGFDRIPSQLYHDISVRYRVDQAVMLRGALDNKGRCWACRTCSTRACPSSRRPARVSGTAPMPTRGCGGSHSRCANP